MNRIVVLTGPSGVGKSSYIKRLLTARRLVFPMVATTRLARADDTGRYLYVDTSKFQLMVAAGQFVEHDSFCGHSYGTLRCSVEKLLVSPDIDGLILDLTPHGCSQFLDEFSFARCIALVPDDPAWLLLRLNGRNTNQSTEITHRMSQSAAHIEAIKQLKCEQLVVRYADPHEAVFVKLLALIGE